MSMVDWKFLKPNNIYNHTFLFIETALVVHIGILNKILIILIDK